MHIGVMVCLARTAIDSSFAAGLARYVALQVTAAAATDEEDDELSAHDATGTGFALLLNGLGSPMLLRPLVTLRGELSSTRTNTHTHTHTH